MKKIETIASAAVLAGALDTTPPTSAWYRGIAYYTKLLAKNLPEEVPTDWGRYRLLEALLCGEGGWRRYAWSDNHGLPRTPRAIFETLLPPTRVDREAASWFVAAHLLERALDEAASALIDSFYCQTHDQIY